MEDIFAENQRNPFARSRMSVFNSPRRKPINATELGNLNKDESDYEFSSSSASQASSLRSSQKLSEIEIVPNNNDDNKNDIERNTKDINDNSDNKNSKQDR